MKVEEQLAPLVPPPPVERGPNDQEAVVVLRAMIDPPEARGSRMRRVAVQVEAGDDLARAHATARQDLERLMAGRPGMFVQGRERFDSQGRRWCEAHHLGWDEG